MVSLVSLIFPIMLSQITVLKANKHVPPSVGTSVQVIVGQLPQFDARMLYWMVGQSEATGLQLNVNTFETKFAVLM